MSNNKHSLLIVSLGVLISISLIAYSVYATSIGSTITTAGLTVSGNTTTTNLVITTNSQLGTVSSGTWQGTPIADPYVTSSLTISGGTINNTPIGLTTPSTGAFTALEATGTSTLATTTISGRLGIGTTSPRTRLELDNDGAILATGTLYSGWTEPNLGAGTRLLWYPYKAAFRVGYVNGTQWDNANIGSYSVAMGYNTTASGPYSIAIEDSTTASGQYSTAIGDGTTASGKCSIAMGGLTTASRDYSTAMGVWTTASGIGSTAMGKYTTAQAYYSLAIGRYNVGGGSATSWVSTDPLFEIGIGTSSSNKANALTVLKNGNVGIGIAGPNTLLHIKKDQNDETALRVENSTNDSVAYSSIDVYSATSQGSLRAYPSNSIVSHYADRISLMADGTAAGLDLFTTNTSGDIRFYTGGSGTKNERMRISSFGKIGIGTTTPETNLQVVDPNASSTIRIGDTSKTGCLEMGDGTNLYYIYIDAGNLVATTTKPSICE